VRAVTLALDLFPPAAGWGFLQFVYDWDTVVLDGNATVLTLESELSLCTLNLPCVLQLKGVMKFSGPGQFFCSSISGCSRISFLSVASFCRNNSKTVLKMQGSTLIMSNSSFAGCWSDTDGGVVQAYDLAEVVIDSCIFTDIFSSGFGGAVAAYGSNLSISRSSFQSCIASKGGGAVWSTVYQDCYGSNRTQNTSLLITYSVFKLCSTGGAGGAILADAPASLRSLEKLTVSIKSTRFLQCTSLAEGGGLRISGPTIYAHVRYTRFDSCTSGASGGGISSSSISALSLVACTVHSNTALGAGGGGVHLNQSYFSAYDASVYSNCAPSGGGGAIYWQGWVHPSAIACPEGTSSVDTLFIPAPAPSPANTDRPIFRVGTCAPCGAGTYSDSEGLSACTSCPPGTYSAADGSSVCSGCPAGQYASLEGANSSTACVDCEPGTYSDTAGLSSCTLCPAGTYSAVESAKSSSVCISCPAGQYASLEGANSSTACVDCEPGTYSDTAGLSSCTLCPAGTYSAVESAKSSSVCISCPAGQYASLEGANSSTACVNCEAGSYANTAGVSSCTLCPAGTYSAVESAKSSSGCISCPAGQYASLEGANSLSLCIACGPGTYSDTLGMSTCTQCSTGQTSFPSGSNSSSACTMCWSASSSDNMDGLRTKFEKESQSKQEISVLRARPSNGVRSDQNESGNQRSLGLDMVKKSVAFKADTKNKTYKLEPSIKVDGHIICSPGQQDILKEIESASLDSIHVLRRFFSSLIAQTGASNTKEMVKLILGGRHTVSRADIPQECGKSDLASDNFRSSTSAVNTVFNKQFGQHDTKTRKAGGTSIASSSASGGKRAVTLEIKGDTPVKASVPFHAQPQSKSVEMGEESNDYHSSTRRAPLPDLTVHPQAHAELMNESMILSSLCGANNSALYGHHEYCIASDFWKLQVSEVSCMVYSGVEFNFTAVKQDAYGTTILSDSSSILQAIPTTAAGETDSLISVLGSAVSIVKRGQALFQFAVKASFSNIDYDRKLADTNSPIFLSIEGTDMESASGSRMKSDLVLVHMQQGGGVCPQGYILALDQEEEANGSAVCTRCKSGTYSVSPLAPGSPTAFPACLSCPAGGDCSLGGSDIRFRDEETWRVIDGEYILVSCPSGYQKINSTAGTSTGKFSSILQQCKVCLPEQYIVNPDTDSCQQCPPGALNVVDMPISG
jgi:hypothetical protein